MKFNTIEEAVTDILEKNPEARDCDNKLYIDYLKITNPLFLAWDVRQFLSNHKDYDIPPMESVTRIRRKVQRDRLDLAPTKRVKAFRDNLEQEYREYARA